MKARGCLMPRAAAASAFLALLLLGGAVRRLPNKTKDAWEWIYGPQPSGERQVRYYDIVRTLRDDVH